MLVIHLLVLVHNHRQFLPLWQGLHFAPDRQHPLPPHQRFFGRHRTVGHVHRRARFLIRFVQADCDLRTLLARVARMINRQVGRNPIQPGGELGAGFVTPARAIHPQKNFLRQIFSRGGVARHPVHKTYQWPAILLHQEVESGLVPRLHPQHDLGVGVAFGAGHCWFEIAGWARS